MPTVLSAVALLLLVTSSALAVDDLSAGGYHTCTVANGRAYCFGSNRFGEKGGGTFNDDDDGAPSVVLAPLTNAVEIAVGLFFPCARVRTGNVFCWGSGDSGQLGNAALTYRASLPTPVVNIPAAAAAVDIATGDNHACAVVNTGSMYCWGANENGQLGDGTNSSRPTPMAVPGLGSVVEVAALADSTCARVSNDSVFCFGKNSEGQLGDGTTAERLSPVAVLNLGSVAALTGGTRHAW
jgi:alpha-tubulin suppressor-like RCC1 family protein